MYQQQGANCVLDALRTYLTCQSGFFWILNENRFNKSGNKHRTNEGSTLISLSLYMFISIYYTSSKKNNHTACTMIIMEILIMILNFYHIILKLRSSRLPKYWFLKKQSQRLGKNHSLEPPPTQHASHHQMFVTGILGGVGGVGLNYSQDPKSSSWMASLSFLFLFFQLPFLHFNSSLLLHWWIWQIYTPQV